MDNYLRCAFVPAVWKEVVLKKVTKMVDTASLISGFLGSLFTAIISYLVYRMKIENQVATLLYAAKGIDENRKKVAENDVRIKALEVQVNDLNSKKERFRALEKRILEIELLDRIIPDIYKLGSKKSKQTFEEEDKK